MKSPIVGTSHAAPRTTSTMFIGVRVSARRSFAETASLGSGITIAGAAAATTPPS